MWDGGFSTCSIDQVRRCGRWSVVGETQAGYWAAGASRQWDQPQARMTPKAIVGADLGRFPGKRHGDGPPCRISPFNDPAVLAKFPVLPAVLKGMVRAGREPMADQGVEQVNIMIYDEVKRCAKTKKPEQAAAT